MMGFMPQITRTYLTASALTTAACALELESPFSFYFNSAEIARGQVWRLVTCFLFFGADFSIDWLFNLYFLYRYCSVRGRDPAGMRCFFFFFFFFFFFNLFSLCPKTQRAPPISFIIKSVCFYGHFRTPIYIKKN
jgi:hypothetical protein